MLAFDTPRSYRRGRLSSPFTVGTLTAGSFAAVATRFTVCSAVIMKYDGLDSKLLLPVRPDDAQFIYRAVVSQAKSER